MKKLFDQTIKNNLRTYDNIPKIAPRPVDDYLTGWILDYPDFIKCKQKNRCWSESNTIN